MPLWSESGVGEHLRVVDVHEPLRWYLEAALGSPEVAEEALCQLFEALIQLPSEQHPRSKYEWFCSIDALAIQRSRSTMQSEFRDKPVDPALSKIFMTLPSNDTLFLVRWLNAGAHSGKGQC